MLSKEPKQQLCREFFIIAIALQKLLISKAAFMLLIRYPKWHFLSIMRRLLIFSTDISGILGGLNLAHA